MDAEERRKQVKEAHLKIAETLIESAPEPRRRQAVLADPGAVFKRAEGAEPSNELVDDLRRQVATGLMDRLAQDPDFANLLREDLFQAIRSAGLSPQLEQLRAEKPVGAEVTGFGWGWPGGWPLWSMLGW
jgi:hypothetical protein